MREWKEGGMKRALEWKRCEKYTRDDFGRLNLHEVLLDERVSEELADARLQAKDGLAGRSLGERERKKEG